MVWPAPWARENLQKGGGETPHIFEGFPGPPGPVRPQKRTPKKTARLPSGTQVFIVFDNVTLFLMGGPGPQNVFSMIPPMTNQSVPDRVPPLSFDSGSCTLGQHVFRYSSHSLLITSSGQGGGWVPLHCPGEALPGAARRSRGAGGDFPEPSEGLPGHPNCKTRCPEPACLGYIPDPLTDGTLVYGPPGGRI